MNENLFDDILKRNQGKDERQEDKLSDKDKAALQEYVDMFVCQVVYGKDYKNNLEDFISYIYDFENNITIERFNADTRKIVDYVKSVYYDELCDTIEMKIEEEESLEENVFDNMLKRGRKEEIRKEDDLSAENKKRLKQYIYFYANSVEMGIRKMDDDDPDEFTFFIMHNSDLSIGIKSWEVGVIVNYIDNNWDIVYKEILDMREFIRKSTNPERKKYFDSLMNENVFDDILKRSSGVAERTEDTILGDNDMKTLDELVNMFSYNVGVEEVYVNELEAFIDYIDSYKNKKSFEKYNPDFDVIKKYVERNWDKGEYRDGENLHDYIEGCAEQERKEHFVDLNENVFDQMLDRSRSETRRQEDEPDRHIIEYMENSVKNFASYLVFGDGEYYKNAYCFGEYMRTFNKKSDDLEAGINYVKRNWDKGKKYISVIDKCMDDYADMLDKKGFEKVPGKSISGMLYDFWTNAGVKAQSEMLIDIGCMKHPSGDTNLMDDCWTRLSWEEQIDAYMKWKDVFECDCAAPNGGAVFGDVSGMGPINLPGECGPAGSGDLPMPSGRVYKQVAPFDTFIKIKKSKKGKKKKFRKEDEPCVHSPNGPMYNYVDDYRDYVDRTYNQVDRRK